MDTARRPRRTGRSTAPGPALARAVLAVALVATPPPAAAQATLASDRPGLGSGAAVMGRGLLQFELGGEYAESDEADRISLGQGLLRFGLLDGLELQALLGSFTVLPGDDEGTRGLQDVGLGAKLRLPGGGDAFAWSAAASVLLPTGAEGLTADETVAFAALYGDLALSDRVGVSVNLGTSGWATDAGDQVVLIVTPSVALAGDSPVGLYAGYAGYYADGADLHWAEGGVTWRRGPDLQLDANGGVEVESGDWFVGLGVATRWRVIR